MNGWKTVPAGLRLLAAAFVVISLVAPAAQAQTPAEIQAALDAAHAKYRDLKEGKNADYIPALAKVDPKIFGIALVTADGKVYTAGDVKSEVSIQSISKVFTMAKVMEESGPDAIASTIGVDATGMRFNSIVSIELSQKALGGPEMNALVNLMCYPVKDVMVGGEIQWGKRENYSDGWSVDDLRFQFSAKAIFSALWGGK